MAGGESPPFLSDRAGRLGLAGLALFALLVRLPTLAGHPIVEGDGVHYASLARRALAGDLGGLGDLYWSNVWPAAIAGVSRGTGLDVVKAGRVASLVSGALLAPLTGAIGARLFGPLAGWTAALLVAGHPWLVHFSGLVYAEAFFLALLLGGLAVGLGAARTRRPTGLVGAGFLMGLAAATRPEALFYAAGLLLLLLAPRAGEPPLPLRPAAWRSAGLLLAPFLLVLAGRSILVWSENGTWDFWGSFKGRANFFLGEQKEVFQNTATERTPEGELEYFADARQRSVLESVLAHPEGLRARAVRNFPLGVEAAKRVIPPVPLFLGRSAFPGPGWTAVLHGMGALSFLLAAFGLLSGLSRATTRLATGAIVGAGALHALTLVFLLVHDRLLLSLVPFAAIFSAQGLVVATGAIARRVAPGARGDGGRVAWGVPLGVAASHAVLSLFGAAFAPTPAYPEEPVVQREAGEWLAGRFDRETRLMTPTPHVAFYFYDAAHERNRVDLPWADYDGVLAFARVHGAHLLAAPEWFLREWHHPCADLLLDATGDHPGLEYVASVGDRQPYRVHLYRFTDRR
ncbi:MAG TPA: hypothetical protein VFI25_15670 [Planctomycetota bacterium]|jgi:4-amino-4-deoxy-L-arabinose transferase-like glycosyltransferase|nr:hypothetical protein [Planctomycetota bacterium]